MQLGDEERRIVADVARAYGVAEPALAAAIEHESAPELAGLLGMTEQEAELRLAPIRRAVAVGDDWSAGCKLLTDEVRAELMSGLRALLPRHHSASFGVSHG